MCIKEGKAIHKNVDIFSMYRGDIEQYEPQKKIRACTAVSEINNK